MRRSILQSAAVFLSAMALGTAGTRLASAATVAITPWILNAPGVSAKSITDDQLTSGAETDYGILPELMGTGFEDATFGRESSQYQQTDESLYLYSSALGARGNARALGENLLSSFKASPGEITTVPPPVVGWLLGAGLLGLIGIARPRRLVTENLPRASDASAERRRHGDLMPTRNRNKISEYRWYGAYASWPGELC
jgi:hypothetical protein